MRDGAKVASLCNAMRKGLEQSSSGMHDNAEPHERQQQQIPVTVKCRIGVDDAGFFLIFVLFKLLDMANIAKSIFFFFPRNIR